ncbi:MAG TPA: hypothetical protein VIW80_02940 [Pyrinomonadaceae bacterium]|jgi:hypothetical protein
MSEYAVNGNNNHSGETSIHFEDLNFDLSDHSNRRYQKPPSEYEDQVWHLGWTDGRYGQPTEDNEAVLRHRAKLRWRQMIALAESEAAATKGIIAQLEDHITRLRLKLQPVQDAYIDLTQARCANPQTFSLSLFIIYSIAAFFLFAADLPLSLKLVAYGYGVTTKDSLKEMSVDNFLTNPRFVVTHFWEALLLAFGIALAGIFIKYFFDTIVFREEQKTLTWPFRIAIGFVLFLFILTTIALGLFRSDKQKELNLTDLGNKRWVLQQERQNVSTQQAIQDMDVLIEKERSEGRASVRTLSFIALTLLFPIVGGICFSVGWRKVVKYWHYRRVKKELSVLEQEYKTETSELRRISETLSAQEKKLARMLEEYADGDEWAEMQISIYRHGYMRGRNVPETIDSGASLYERCENSVAKLLSKKMRAKYWENQQSGTI